MRSQRLGRSRGCSKVIWGAMVHLEMTSGGEDIVVLWREIMKVSLESVSMYIFRWVEERREEQD